MHRCEHDVRVLFIHCDYITKRQFCVCVPYIFVYCRAKHYFHPYSINSALLLHSGSSCASGYDLHTYRFAKELRWNYYFRLSTHSAIVYELANRVSRTTNWPFLLFYRNPTHWWCSTSLVFCICAYVTVEAIFVDNLCGRICCRKENRRK